MRSISAIVGVSLLVGWRSSRRTCPADEAQASPPAASADGDEVFRPYGAAGGLKDEFEQLAAEHPDITKLVTIGQTVQGEDIVALKVSRHASRIRDGRRPATLYIGGPARPRVDHAGDDAPARPPRRRRLRHRPHHHRPGRHAPSCGSCPSPTPTATTTRSQPGNRLWRKNLRDNDGDGRITAGDGVDLNRNFPTKWGYDNEGSSPDAGSETYRGTGPASEPETQALDGLHDAGRLRVPHQLPLRRRAAALRHRLAGGHAHARRRRSTRRWSATTRHPAVPGYDPTSRPSCTPPTATPTSTPTSPTARSAFTPEMSTCQTAAASDPDDEWDPADCASGFDFPDDEALVATPARAFLHRARASPCPSRRRHREPGWALGRPTDAELHHDPGRAGAAAALPDPRPRHQVHRRLRRGLPQRRDQVRGARRMSPPSGSRIPAGASGRKSVPAGSWSVPRGPVVPMRIYNSA